MRNGCKPKFDYDSDDFYDEIKNLAMQGMTDGEIADSLSEKFGLSLTPGTFCEMKNGNYTLWDKNTQLVRSQRITESIAQGKRRTTAILRGAYLKAALGGKRLHNKSTTIVSLYDTDGNKVGERETQRVESENEMAPNLQAISALLYNYDPEWRSLRRGDPDDENAQGGKGKGGVDIDAWIKRESEMKREEAKDEAAAGGAEEAPAAQP